MNKEKQKILAYKFNYDENGKFKEMKTKEVEVENVEVSLVKQIHLVKGSKEYEEALKNGIIKE